MGNEDDEEEEEDEDAKDKEEEKKANEIDGNSVIEIGMQFNRFNQ